MPFFDGMVAELILGQNYFNQPQEMILVQWLTRILVALELWVGIALLQNKGFIKVTLPLTLLTLILFTIHLFYESLKTENGFTEGNCGCFGDVLPMNNLESITKNIVGIALAIYVWIKYNNQTFRTWIPSFFVGLVTLFTLSFGVKSYQNVSETESLSTSIQDTIDQDTIAVNFLDSLSVDSASNSTSNKETLIEESQEKIIRQKEIITTIPNIDASVSNQNKPQSTIELLKYYAPDLKSHLQKNDTTLVCLFSMTCSHCQEVYRDISSMKSSPQLPPIYLINYGTSYEQNYFFSQAGSSKDPHFKIEDFTIFKRLLEGKTYPRILCVSNGKILKEWDVDSYQKEQFINHFGIKEINEKEKDGGLQLDLNQGESPW